MLYSDSSSYQEMLWGWSMFFHHPIWYYPLGSLYSSLTWYIETGVLHLCLCQVTRITIALDHVYAIFPLHCMSTRTPWDSNEPSSWENIKGFFRNSQSNINPFFVGSTLLDRGSEDQYVIQSYEPLLKVCCPAGQHSFLSTHTHIIDSLANQWLIMIVL